MAGEFTEDLSQFPQGGRAEAALERLLTEIGAGSLQVLVDSVEKEQSPGVNAVVGFPVDEHEHGLAVRKDGTVQFSYDREDSFTIPTETAQLIAGKVLEREKAVRENRARIAVQGLDT